METTTIKITGMSCAGCTASVTKVLTETPGVAKVEVRLSPGQAVV
ncbi:MAG: heavy-metal-associated domain-containing protein, partial [Gemmobacter sp.]